MVPSALPLASVRPPGLNATELTRAVARGGGWASGRGWSGWVDAIPQPDATIAAAGQRPPAGAKRHRVHEGAVAGRGLAERAGMRGIGDVPQPDGAIGAAGGQHVPAGAERHRIN